MEAGTASTEIDVIVNGAEATAILATPVMLV
jgi:hypothetical protein